MDAILICEINIYIEKGAVGNGLKTWSALKDDIILPIYRWTFRVILSLICPLSM